MTGTRQSKKDVSEIVSSDQNSIVYWLRKIHEKMENIEKCQFENSQMMKEQQRGIQEIAGEVLNIKAQMNQGPVTDKGYITGEQRQPSATAGKSWFDKGRDVQQHFQTRKLAYYNQLRSGGIASIYK